MRGRDIVRFSLLSVVYIVLRSGWDCGMFIHPVSRKRVKNQGFCFETSLFMCYRNHAKCDLESYLKVYFLILW